MPISAISSFIPSMFLDHFVNRHFFCTEKDSFVYASQAEALLRLGRHEEADSVLKSAPKFETDAIINVFGAAVSGCILVIEAEVDLASGRFDEAVKVAERAARDHNSREISGMVRRARAVSCARSKQRQRALQVLQLSRGV
ncbi:Inactive TPR repeat-containing thioredoxin TTL3 [Platanthera zijinensis]|uniref:Inactive TPR repeat-containing thioredoxin TTL3 n=1 Tax=Platanthera zijinensis TaxID=2320716 RepID=A0AAP0B9L2_9ASPA